MHSFYLVIYIYIFFFGRNAKTITNFTKKNVQML